MPPNSGGSSTNFEDFTVPLEEISDIQPTPQHVIAGSSLESPPSHSETHPWIDNGGLVWVISSLSSMPPWTPPSHEPQSTIAPQLPRGNTRTIDTITSTRLRIIEQEEDLRTYGLRYRRRVQRTTEIIMGMFLLLGMALGLGSVLAIVGQGAGLGQLELRSWARYTRSKATVL